MPTGHKRKILNTVYLVAGCWLIFVGLPSSVFMRNWLTAPLVIQDEDARGEACYVLAGGEAIWERLAAGVDLFKMGKVPSLMIMRDDSTGPYNFKNQESWTRTQWMMDYLNWHEVPIQNIKLLNQVTGFYGTLTEARNVAKQLPENIKRLVVVSSAPHMRRSVLAFRRSLPSDVKVIPYAATSFEASYEMYWPIWVEYFKLLVYYIVA